MKALQITTPENIQLVERPMPVAADGEVLLKINYVGFCGSDLSTYLGKNPMVEYPRVPGHEISATIVSLGEEVPAGFNVKQSVTVVPYTNCGQCSSCRKGRFNACRYNQTLGVQRDGAMQEFIAVPWQKLLVDDKLSALELAMVEPLTVGFHAIDRAKVTDTDIVMVFGCGMIGAGAIIGAVIRGAKVIAVDIDDQKLELARKIGAAHCINSKTTNLHDVLQQITDGHGPDVVIEAAGNPATYQAAFEEVAFAGRVACIGYAKSDISFSTKLWVQKEIELFGSRNATPSDFEAVIHYLKQGNFPLMKMITRVIQPEEAPDAVAEWASNPGQVMKILVKF
ncbi:MAG TPA: zinc-binding alcohol dehydrogenase family protein [Prolixibacteraceae bacterium]|nr:zinc-binding alcohol dehydrogenase family protein [Prolixibacteraceae bacterium]